MIVINFMYDEITMLYYEMTYVDKSVVGYNKDCSDIGLTESPFVLDVGSLISPMVKPWFTIVTTVPQ